jgi:ABC-type oligopeptide transport system ATPase subunit
MQKLLEAHGITKAFGKGTAAITAVDAVNLDIGEGEIVGLIGESGSGKSTFGSIFCGLEEADAGSVSFCGTDCEATTAMRKRSSRAKGVLRNMQVVFQNPQSTFSDRMKIGAGIAEGIAHREDVSRSERQMRMFEALDAVGLPRAYADRHAWELSGGECQRAAIARAVISRPRLLICDEPTSALDVTVQAQIISLLVDLCHERSMSCLFISHDLVLVRGFCSRLYVMQKGCIVEENTTDELFENPKDPYTRQLLDAVIAL